jgi:hypothetical protein
MLKKVVDNLKSYNGVLAMAGSASILFAVFNGITLVTLLVTGAIGVVAGIYNGLKN